MAVESVTIVGSILLAFAIQAWWDSLQEADLKAQALVTLEEELALLDTDGRAGHEIGAGHVS